MTTSNTQGFFSEEEMDRLNIKTLLDPLPEGVEQEDVLAVLVHQSISVGSQLLSLADAKTKVIDWYCSSSIEKLIPQIQLTKGAGITLKKLKEAIDYANSKQTN